MMAKSESQPSNPNLSGDRDIRAKFGIPKSPQYLDIGQSWTQTEVFSIFGFLVNLL